LPPLSLRPYCPHFDLHSFPPRRSSDLLAEFARDEHAPSRLLGSRRIETGSDPVDRGPQAGRDRLGDLRRDRVPDLGVVAALEERDRKSTRLNSSHVKSSYAVFCLKKKM